jgi:hypothetical protein
LANGTATAHVTRAQYLFSADGLVAIENAIKILVLETTLTAHCTITVHPQNLGTIKYDTDSSSTLLELSEVHSIKALSSGEPCGPAGELTGGTYTGSNLIELFAGTLKWS